MKSIRGVQVISDINELKKLTKSEDIKLEDSRYYGCCSGTYKGEKIDIEYLGETLIVGISVEEQKYRQELIELFSKMMGNKEPICEYDFAYMGDKSKNNEPTIIDHTIEWNVENPDYRMEKVIKGIGFEKDHKPINIVEYHQSVERKMEVYEITKFSPSLFKGAIGSDELHKSFKKCTEDELFLILRTMGNMQAYVSNRVWNDYWPDLTNVAYSCDVAIQNVGRYLFGPSSVTLSADKIKDSKEYKAWCKKWGTYFDFNTQCEYMKRKINNEDVSMFKPENLRVKQYS